MDLLYELYVGCGWLYSFLLVTSFAAGLFFLVVPLFRHSKRTPWTALLVALLPLAIGLFGTYDGYRAIDDVLATTDLQPEPAEAAAVVQQARATSYVGGAFSIILLALAVPCCAVGTQAKGEAPRR
jgi:hypothetical protein